MHLTFINAAPAAQVRLPSLACKNVKRPTLENSAKIRIDTIEFFPSEIPLTARTVKSP